MAEYESDRMYENRARAMSFGGVAALYDKARPSYPSAMIDALLAFTPRSVLDVGCGTGKASRMLLERGCNVVGVEPDAAMAAIARSHGVTVEEATFETWDPRGRMYDLIVSGQAWHWVNPEVGVVKAASLLHPGGHLGVFWNQGRPERRAAEALEAVYQRIAPGIAGSNVAIKPPQEPRDRLQEFSKGGLFTDIEARAFPWDTVYDRASWTEFISTHSDHVQLPEEQRRALLDALGEAVDALGGSMTYHYSTLLVLATRKM